MNAPLLAFLGIPPGPLMGMALAVVVFILLLWGVKEPLAWVVVSFLAIGIGVGCLIYGCSQAYLLPEPRTSQAVSEVSVFVGGGAGGTVGGIVLLVVSMIRRKRTPVATT
jgi:hypothetical protein